MRPSLLTLLSGSRTAVWAAIATLALFQAAIAGHSTQHALEDVGESCEFCLKLDEAKSTFADSGEALPLPRPDDAPGTDPDATPSARPVPSYSIRAPPLV